MNTDIYIEPRRPKCSKCGQPSTCFVLIGSKWSEELKRLVGGHYHSMCNECADKQQCYGEEYE